MMRSVTLVIAIVFAFPAATCAQATITACPADSIRAWMKAYHVPAVGMGIIEKGKIKSVNVYGEIRPGVPAPPNTIWMVASLTKPVTATVVLSLVNKGKWNLDERVSKYWIDPDVKESPYTSLLTTRILLTHRSGFKNWRSSEPDKKLAFHFSPGSKMGYSGEGYEYVRMALEKKFNKTLQQLAEEELFKPAGIKNAHFGWSDGVDSLRFAEAYSKEGTRYPAVSKGITHPSRIRGNNAANWLLIDVENYCRFGTYVIHGAGLSKKLFEDMATVHSPTDTTATGKITGMGIGWQVIKDLPNGEFVLTHNGSNKGVATIIVLFPKSQRGIVIFTNGDEGAQLYSKILKESGIDLQSALADYMEVFR